MREEQHPHLSLDHTSNGIQVVSSQRRGRDAERVRQPTFEELLQKRSMGPVPVAQQGAEHMRLLLPKVHRLLVFLPTLVDQNVDDIGIGHVAVLLEALADDGAHRRRWDVKGV